MEIQLGTDVGQRRKNNEDYAAYFYNEDGQLLVLLADGMGGHQAGDIASRSVVENLGALWKQTDALNVTQASDWLWAQIQLENKKIVDQWYEDENKYGMGTTIIALVVIRSHVVIAHVGDSRVYLLNEQGIQQITEDHSLINILLKNGEIDEEMAANHPKKNMLTSTVGMEGPMEIETCVHKKNSGYFLLCSDGLSSMLTPEEIYQCVMEEKDLSTAVQRLLLLANDAGGYDNITVALLDCEGKEEE